MSLSLLTTTPPGIVLLLCQLLALSDWETTLFWQSLQASMWSEVTEWRRQFLLYEVVGDAATMAQTVASPVVLMRVLDVLIQEGRLQPRTGSQIQEKLLDLLDADGAYI